MKQEKSIKQVTVVFPDKKGVIAPEIYGHFSEHIGGVIYDGIWVGRDSEIPNIKGFRKDIIEKMRALNPPVIRWPGGCFAETYHWRDGIGKKRPVRPNWWTKWDGRYESNEVGTHEFMEFCELIGAKPYFAVNVTSITPMEARDWMDYCLSPRGTTTLAMEREANGHPEPFDIPYWGVGNENWGEEYHQRYRKFYAAIKEKYPELILIADQMIPDAPMDMVDDHYYTVPQTFPTMYDAYEGEGVPVYVGEYACNQEVGYGNLLGAVSDAAFMIRM